MNHGARRYRLGEQTCGARGPGLHRIRKAEFINEKDNEQMSFAGCLTIAVISLGMLWAIGSLITERPPIGEFKRYQKRLAEAAPLRMPDPPEGYEWNIDYGSGAKNCMIYLDRKGGKPHQPRVEHGVEMWTSTRSIGNKYGWCGNNDPRAIERATRELLARIIALEIESRQSQHRIC